MLKQQVLDTALQLANLHGWEQLSLHQIAQQLNISLADIQLHYSQKDALTDAWFDRADTAMLQLPLAADTSAADRLQLAITTWLQSLAPERKLTKQMLCYKLEPGHIHLQAAAILRISRTVQWLRELAMLNASGVARIGQELALSALFVSVFIYWLNDNSATQQRSLQMLHHKLALGDKLNLWH
jgi:ubiquinone biosynthesis protein COQ9